MEVKGEMKVKTAILCLAVVTAFAALLNIILFMMAGDTAGKVTVMEAPAQSEMFTHDAFVIEEYESVIPDGTNIATEAKAFANGQTDVYGANKAVDGKTSGTSYWEGETDAYPNILTLAFKESHKIHAAKLLLNPLAVWSARNQTFSVEVSSDGESFTELLPSAIYEFTPKRNNEVVLEFPETEVVAVRFIFTENTGAGGAQVAEAEIYEK